MAMFIGSIVLVFAFAIILQQIGAPVLLINLWVLVFGIGIYVFSGLAGKTMRFATFHDADQISAPAFCGMAIASGVISGQFLLLPGETYSGSEMFPIYYSGVLLGIVLGTMLFAGGLSRHRATTLSGILFPQGSSRVLVALATISVCICSMALVLAQFKVMGLFMKGVFGLSESQSIWLMLFVVCVCLVFGGMRGLGTVRVITYAGIVFGLFLPLIWISMKISGNPIPQFSFGPSALQPVLEIDREMVEAGFAEAGDVFNPLDGYKQSSTINLLLSTLTIAGGIAALPHLLQHYRTVAKGRRARSAGIWAFWLVAIVISTVPVIAVFARYNLYTSILGLQISDLATEAPWLFSISGAGELPLITICGKLVGSTSDILAACGNSSEAFISLRDIGINSDYLLLASAALGELPSLLTIMIVLAGLLCVLSTLDGLLLVMANTITADLYNRLFRPRSPPGIKLFMNRFFLIVAAAFAAFIYPHIQLGSEALFTFAIALGCATLFPLLASRLWLPALKELDLGIALAGSLLITGYLLLMTLGGKDFVGNTGDELAILPGVVTGGLSPMSLGVLGMIICFLIAFASQMVRTRNRKPEQKENANATA